MSRLLDARAPVGPDPNGARSDSLAWSWWQCGRMPKRSAGLLLYRRGGGTIEVLLVHPGGPFWARRDDGVWSVPKGEVADGDDRATAAREFAEELGQPPPTSGWTDLGEVVQSGGKRVRVVGGRGRLRADRAQEQHIRDRVAAPLGPPGDVSRGRPGRVELAGRRGPPPGAGPGRVGQPAHRPSRPVGLAGRRDHRRRGDRSGLSGRSGGPLHSGQGAPPLRSPPANEATASPTASRSRPARCRTTCSRTPRRWVG